MNTSHRLFSRFLSANIVFLSHSRSFCCPLTQPLTKKREAWIDSQTGSLRFEWLKKEKIQEKTTKLLLTLRCQNRGHCIWVSGKEKEKTFFLDFSGMVFMHAHPSARVGVVVGWVLALLITDRYTYICMYIPTLFKSTVITRKVVGMMMIT